MIEGYRLGLPAWAFPGWRGRYFTANADPLEQYSSVFNAVEGNTTFYGVPAAAKVSHWLQQVAERDFRFCFKLPQSVTHRRHSSAADFQALLAALTPLEGHLGPLLVQFPPTVGAPELAAVTRLLARLPAAWSRVVELRDPALFRQPELLERYRDAWGCNLVTMDAHPLHQGDPTHPAVIGALHEKAALPGLDAMPAPLEDEPSLLRLVLHPDDARTPEALECWARRTSERVRLHRPTYVTIHCPDNGCCPAFAVAFHEALSGYSDVGTLPTWPQPQQDNLF